MRMTLGIKMTLTSTLLVAVVVAMMGYIHAINIRSEHKDWEQERETTFRQNALQLAENGANILAVSTSEHLSGTEIEPLELVVEELVKKDDRILLVQLADTRGVILADSSRDVQAGALERLEVDEAALAKEVVADTTVNGKRALTVRRPITAQDAAGGQKFIGVVVFGYDLTPLDGQLATLRDDAEKSISSALSFTLKIGLIALVLGVLLSLLQAARFSRPIRRLAQTTRQIAEGDLSARVAVKGNDEIGVLGHQFNHMANRVEHLLVEAVAKAEMERELDLAREIQSVLVPGPGTHNAPGIEVCGHYEPASTCGGDFWDLAALPRGRSSILIGDVTGHGVAASILTATAKGCLDTLRHVHGENIQVAETMRVLDRVIAEAGHGAFFMTAAAMVLDATQGTLYYSAAAHPPGLLLRWTESGIKLSRLQARGNRLGDGDASGFEARRIRVVKGDLLVWYTDGLTDAIDATGKTYSNRRLLQILSKTDITSSPEHVVSLVVEDLNRFRGGTPLEDDVTLVIGRIT